MIKPLNDRIIVKRSDEVTSTASGILLANVAVEKPLTGKVIAVGTGRKDPLGNMVPLEVTVGDTVLFGRYAGQALILEGAEYTTMKEEDVIGILL